MELARRPVELGVGLRGVQLAQEHLGMGPGQIEDAVGQPPVLVFPYQAQGRLAGLPHAKDHVDGRGLFRLQEDAVANGHDGIKHRPLAVGKLPGKEPGAGAHGLRIGHGIGPADEFHAVGLVGDVPGLGPVHGHHVQHPGGLLALGAGPAGAEDGPLPGQYLGLHEEVAERRMQLIGRWRGQDHFGVTGDVDDPAYPGAVGDADAAQLDVVLGRNRDLGMGVVVVVPAVELSPPFGKDRLEMLGGLERGLKGRGPELPAGHVADVAEDPPVVAGAVLAPAGDGQVLPPAGAPPGVGDHHVVAAVGEQLHFGMRGVGRVEHPDRSLGAREDRCCSDISVVCA